MRILQGRETRCLVVGMVLALALGPGRGAWAGDKTEAKPAEPKAEAATPAEAAPPTEAAKPAPAATPAPAKAPAPAAAPAKAKKPATPWSTYSSSDGQYAWAEPSGWTLDTTSSIAGQTMVWNEPNNAGGQFRIVAYAKTGASLADLVRATSYGGKPRAAKAWLCAQGQHGDQKVAVAARVLENGDYLLLVLSASPATFKWLGGMPGVRSAANAVFGFKPAGMRIDTSASDL
jgi:hypothetical protein